jgi:hypothetical protein
MNKIINKLKKEEKKIVSTAYKIALVKQDIALNVTEALLKVFDQESPKKFSKEEIANRVFEEAKKIPNKEVEKYVAAPIEEKINIRLRLEKKIIENLRKNQANIK